MTLPAYPLEQVVAVKERRVEQQEKVVQEKREALQQEERKLEECIEQRNKVRKHYDDKLQQLRDELDGETTSDKIEQMKLYLEVVQERLKAEDKKVKEQKERVEAAKKDLEAAKAELQRRRIDVDKLVSHRKDWETTVKKELQLVAEREEDEIGNVIFSMKRRGRPAK
jgi:chromosome segregation ATPase